MSRQEEIIGSPAELTGRLRRNGPQLAAERAALKRSLLIRDKLFGRRVPLLEPCCAAGGAVPVVDAHQIETLRWRHWSARRSVASAEGCGQVGRRPLALTDQLE